jgi:hypothetical protein
MNSLAERHCAVPGPPVAAVVLVAEGHTALVESNEATVRDGDAMGAAVFEYVSSCPPFIRCGRDQARLLDTARAAADTQHRTELEGLTPFIVVV